MTRIVFLSILSILSITLSPSPLSAETMADRAFELLEKSPAICDDHFDFVVIGDTRSSKPIGLPDTFKQIIREMNVLRPAFIIECGDLILGGAAEGLDPQWTEFEEVVSHCEIPFFPVTGNHDISDAATQKIWTDRVGPTQYTFRHGNSLFIALDSEEVGALDRISDKQVEWVRENLERTDAKNVFLFMHKPYFAQDWEENWSNVAEVLKDYPSVKTVFGSDIHLYRSMGKRDGVRYVITGGGGAPIGVPEEEGGFYHYLLVRVRGDQVAWSVVRPGSIMPEDVVTADRVKEIRAIRQQWVGTEPVEVAYGEGVDRQVRVLIQNPYETGFESDLTWTVPAGWTVSPTHTAYAAPPETTTELTFRVRADGPEAVRFPAPSLSTAFEKTRHGGPIEVNREMSLVPVTVATRASETVLVDGDLDEWKGAEAIPLTYDEGFDKADTEDLVSQVRFMWDEENFYLAVETEDDEFHQPYAGDIVWLADNVELFLDKWSWGLSLTEAGPEVFLYWGIDRSRETVNTEVQLAVKRDGRLTTYEAAFPKVVVKPLALEAGSACRFSMIMNDLDSRVPDRPRHWLELTPGAGSGTGRFPRAKVILGE